MNSKLKKEGELHNLILEHVTSLVIEGDKPVDDYVTLLDIYTEAQDVDYPNNHNVRVKDQYMDHTIEQVLNVIKEYEDIIYNILDVNNSVILDMLKDFESKIVSGNDIPKPEHVLIKMIDDGKILDNQIKTITMSMTNINDGLLKTVVNLKPSPATLKTICDVHLNEINGLSDEPIKNSIVLSLGDFNTDVESLKQSSTLKMSFYNNYDCQLILEDVTNNETYISDNVFKLEDLFNLKK